MDDIDKVLTRGVEQILPSKDGLRKLMESKKITLYQGFDPSMPSLHLGNLVGLMKLRQFQALGHRVIFLVGDFTGMIGDPDKISTRKPLTREQVLKNSETWKELVSKVLEFDGNNPIQIMFNSKWNDPITYKELIDIASHFTVQQILERDMFQKRLQEMRPIRLHELLYPVTQAIDSIKMVDGGVDLEIGGNDQLFNILAGRDLMKYVWKKEKYILTTKLLVDKDGLKVGKTTGNALFLSSGPENFFGGIMSFSDDVIFLCYELLTEVELDGLEEKIKKDPLGLKKALAWEIVKIVWGEGKANSAQKMFESNFQSAQPSYVQEVENKESLVKTIANLVGSTSEAKRLIADGGVDINDEVITNPKHELKSGDKIKVGKKIFVRVRD